ncbi:MAG TPA: Zn-ribbon domain-containing OB-fold protein [Alphaproteobacteria bacterium]
MSTQARDTLDVKREPPPPRSYSRPFWDATRQKKLMVQYDRKAGRYQFYPRATSIFTGRTGDLEWREVSGRGEVFSFSVVRRARPPFEGHEPFVLVVVTIDEGVNVMADLVHCSLEEIRIGLRVKPFWAPLPDGRHLLMFEPEKA